MPGKKTLLEVENGRKIKCENHKFNYQLSRRLTSKGSIAFALISRFQPSSRWMIAFVFKSPMLSFRLIDGFIQVPYVFKIKKRRMVMDYGTVRIKR